MEMLYQLPHLYPSILYPKARRPLAKLQLPPNIYLPPSRRLTLLNPLILLLPHRYQNNSFPQPLTMSNDSNASQD